MATSTQDSYGWTALDLTTGIRDIQAEIADLEAKLLQPGVEKWSIRRQLVVLEAVAAEMAEELEKLGRRVQPKQGL